MLTNFEKCLRIILEHEGGFVDDPNDAGGATNFGISNRAVPIDRDGDGDVDAIDAKLLTVDEAATIYKKRYWDKCGCELLHPALALALFDAAVNQGEGWSPRAFQEAAGVKADGIIGKGTAAAANANPAKMLEKFMTARMLRYAVIPDWKHWARGWTIRFLRTHKECLKLLA